MFGLRLRKEIQKLQNSEASLRKIIENILNDNLYLNRQCSRLDIELAELKMELKNPPKYQVGYSIGDYTVVEVLPLVNNGVSVKRVYKVLNSKAGTVEKYHEDFLGGIKAICKN
jgi:hypothetical protein